MGWVTQLRISGDNDEPIFPVRYEMHYAYCDKCGSFKLDPWQEKTGNRLFNRQQDYGIRCGICDSTYEYGSRFFADLTHNPNGYTMADVPLPLNRNYQQTGNVLGPMDEPD